MLLFIKYQTNKKFRDAMRFKSMNFGRKLTDFLKSSESFAIVHQTLKPVSSRIYVLDSSFNPPHLAHLELINRSIQLHNNNPHVVLLLSVNNADKKPAPASFEQRLDMMHKFGQNLHLGYSVCLSKSPRFVDKSAEIDRHFDGKKVYLLGFDTLIRVFDPKYYKPESVVEALDSFVVSNNFVCLTRKDERELEFQLNYLENLASGTLGLPAKWSNSIELIVNEKDNSIVSSSMIRKNVQENKPIGDYVMADIEKYIQGLKLYQ